MKRYIKKPIPIEAKQYTSSTWQEIQDWSEGIVVAGNHGGLEIHTLEGTMSPSIGDYVVKGPEGEFWFVRKEIFEKTYEVIN